MARQPPNFAAFATFALVLLGGICLWAQLKPWTWQNQPSTSASPSFEVLLSVPASSPYRLPFAEAARAAPRGPLLFPAEGPLDAAALPEHSTEVGECNEAHPNADSPDMLHVVYASDIGQLDGVQASIASVVSSAAAPEELTVHVMVQRQWAADFRAHLGVRPNCDATVTVTGVLLRVHPVEGQLITGSVAKVSKQLLKERGAIDSLENFARFYMHLVFDFEVAIYLDADTVVQADLAQLRRQLLASRKTVGFVARENPVLLEKFLRKPGKDCDVKLNWKKLLKQSAYNVGVFAVNLQRWREQKVVERVERLVAQHNRCGGKLWVGGSQPPLLLAFLDRPEGAAEDFIVFEAGWNAGDLGWRTNLAPSKLRKKFVLHWNGGRKPWQKDGLYKELWQPHRQRFGSLLRPYDSGSGGGQTVPPRARTTSAVPTGPEEAAERLRCPGLELISGWPEADCRLGKSYGCLPRQGAPRADAGLWTEAGCAGLFNASGTLTACGTASQRNECRPGAPSVASAPCGLMILSSYFTTKRDWQRGKFAKASFAKIKILFTTTLRLGLNVTLIYDSLPLELIAKYGSPRFRFQQVSLEDFDRRYGVNDVRYFFFDRLVRAHPEWKALFIVDAFDVRVGMNPCPHLAAGTLYVGLEQDKLRKHPWMKARFQKMGGKYNDWYRAKLTDKMKILNCGITGGLRDVMLKLLGKMVQVLSDPALSVRKKEKEDINLNMAALNYIVYNDFAASFVGGPPVHSIYKRFQTHRTDVWFIHK